VFVSLDIRAVSGAVSSC